MGNEQIGVHFVAAQIAVCHGLQRQPTARLQPRMAARKERPISVNFLLPGGRELREVLKGTERDDSVVWGIWNVIRPALQTHFQAWMVERRDPLELRCTQGETYDMLDAVDIDQTPQH